MAAPFELSSAGETTRTIPPHLEPDLESDELECDVEELEAQPGGD